jgi:nucleoside-diphosphate-sugar epimerase
MSTALIVGATGFVGSHLARRLVRDGLDVHVLCRAASDFRRLHDILPRILAHPVDMSDAAALTSVVRAIRPEQIFHLASATVVAGATPGPRDLVDGNVLATVNLIDACDGIDYRCLVTIGDSFEYSPSVRPLAETDPCRPASLHGITKLAATLYAGAAARAKNRPIVTLRLFSTYGPDDNPRRLVPRVIAGALAGTPLLLSRPEIARDWIYIDDLIALLLETGRDAARLEGEVLNAGTGRNAALVEIVDTVLRLSGAGAQVRWGAFPAPEHDAYPWIADMRHTFATLGWRPSISLEEGLRRTIAAARAATA